MHIFLSWSGEQSKAVASALRDWLKRVVQAFDPWMSERDIDAGLPWFSEIAGELDKARAGILCVTPESLNKPWFMFEAGALAKHVRRDRACPYLLGVEKTHVQGPLAGLQLTVADKPNTWKLVMSLHKLLREENPERSLADADLEESFDTRWPWLEARLEEARKIKTQESPKPDAEAMLRETLLLTREVAEYVSDQRIEAAARRRLASLENLGNFPLDDVATEAYRKGFFERLATRAAEITAKEQAEALEMAPPPAVAAPRHRPRRHMAERPVRPPKTNSGTGENE